MAVKTKCDYLDRKAELLANENHDICKKLKRYYRNEMRGMLESFEKKLDEEDKELGPLLRTLWVRYEDKLKVHDAEVCLGKNEKELDGLNEKERNELVKKKSKFGVFRFENEEENEGVYIDLVYDTYWKDWGKPYQFTFHELFHNIDHIIGKENKFPHYIKNESGKIESPFAEKIEAEVKRLSSSKTDMNRIHKLSKHSKAYLYDIIGGVIHKGRYPRKEDEQYKIDKGQFGHEGWTEKIEKEERNRIVYINSVPIPIGGSTTISGDVIFPGRLAAETFANMASTAVANPGAFKEMKRYLPESYEIFKRILRRMVNPFCVIIDSENRRPNIWRIS